MNNTVREFDAVTPLEDTGFLRFLYQNAVGRLFLRLLMARWVSRLSGAFLDSRFSKPMIKRFIRKNEIDLSLYEKEEYRNFNDFFTRRIRPELRPIEKDPDAFVAPCDGLLSVYPIEQGSVYPIKQSEYTLADLLADEKIAKEFDGGVCLVFRLCVHHYHRYAFADGGKPIANKYIKGKFHTVRPIALRLHPVFKENAREVTLYESDNFGTIAQIEVGAMLVGKIENKPMGERFDRGEEKGRFLYGGSTVVVLVGKNRVNFPKELFDATNEGKEVPVEMGMKLGEKIK
ncbi:MAG: phosphatidylserine decarboxylase [Clostridia bacterium]|nr:phosphatidylserine decarboxylase [Clostridia bacterium]